VRAPGRDVTSLSADGSTRAFDGTSVAAAFVTGAIALLCSEFPTATADRIRHSVLTASARPRRGIVPPLLRADASFKRLAMN
jgi:subtilisin family serine protease